MAQVETTLRGLGLRPTSRLKTINTIIEKLKRERNRLSTIQDIAGLRIVEDCLVSVQDEVVARIAAVFEDAKIHDRREAPSHGYRAVHVIVAIEGFPVEIQVRTRLQDQWAQLFETLADAWGRQIRYGDLPNQPDEVVGGLTREKFVELCQTRIADAIRKTERWMDVAEGLERPTGWRPAQLLRRNRVWRLKRLSRLAERQVRLIMSEFTVVLKEETRE